MISDGHDGVNGARNRDAFCDPPRDMREGGDTKQENPFAPLTRDLGAIQAYAMHYVAARSDALTAQAKKAAVWGALGVMGLFAGITVIVASVVLALVGIAFGLAALLDSLWAGLLITGLGVLLLVGLAAWIGLRYWMNLSLHHAKEKYERRRTKERHDYGRDVAQRAAGSHA